MKYVLRNEFDINAAQEIAEELNLNIILAKLLTARGIKNAESAQDFIKPKLKKLHDPFLFEDMRLACDLINASIEKNEAIGICGDYDCDGVCGASIIFSYIYSKTKNVKLVFPDRINDGYGFSINRLDDLSGVKLLILVDLGITNVCEIEEAKKMGMKVIILDHHECPEILPKADAIINPKLKNTKYPFSHLCGAGLAFKLICALTSQKDALEYVDLAALGTIADVVPLTGENRIIAAVGIAKMQRKPCRGILEICKTAGIDNKKITARQVAFLLAPRINASGRMDSAYHAARVLCNFSVEKYAGELQKLNTMRQNETQRINETIEAGIDEKEKFIYISGDDFLPGVIGLAASRFCEKYSRPVFIFAKNKESYVGSVRSAGGVNIYDILYKHSSMFIKFGGHANAAGLTLTEENMQKLKKLLKKDLKDFEYTQTLEYDLCVNLSEISKDLISQLSLLEPLGHQNPEPVFLIKSVKLEKTTLIGQKKNHIKGTLNDGAGKIDAIAFNFTQYTDLVQSECDMLVNLEFNSYSSSIQAKIISAAVNALEK